MIQTLTVALVLGLLSVSVLPHLTLNADWELSRNALLSVTRCHWSMKEISGPIFPHCFSSLLVFSATKQPTLRFLFTLAWAYMVSMNGHVNAFCRHISLDGHYF